jgi:hypothetical protein
MIFDRIVHVSQKEAKLVLDYLTSPSARKLVKRATVWVGPGNPDSADKQAFLRGIVDALACLPKLEDLHLSLEGCEPNLLGLESVLTNNTLTTLRLSVDVRLEVSRPSAHPVAHSFMITVRQGSPKLYRGPQAQSVPFEPNAGSQRSSLRL